MKTEITFSLSAQAIVDQALALDALKRCTHSAETDNLLGRDHAPAILEATKMAFAQLALLLVPHVADSAINDEAASQQSVNSASASLLMSITLRLPDDITSDSQGVIRRLLEHALTMLALTAVYAASDTAASDRYRQLALGSVERLRKFADSGEKIPTRTALCWI